MGASHSLLRNNQVPLSKEAQPLLPQGLALTAPVTLLHSYTQTCAISPGLQYASAFAASSPPGLMLSTHRPLTLPSAPHKTVSTPPAWRQEPATSRRLLSLSMEVQNIGVTMQVFRSAPGSSRAHASTCTSVCGCQPRRLRFLLPTTSIQHGGATGHRGMLVVTLLLLMPPHGW